MSDVTGGSKVLRTPGVYVPLGTWWNGYSKRYPDLPHLMYSRRYLVRVLLIKLEDIYKRLIAIHKLPALGSRYHHWESELWVLNEVMGTIQGNEERGYMGGLNTTSIEQDASTLLYHLREYTPPYCFIGDVDDTCGCRVDWTALDAAISEGRVILVNESHRWPEDELREREEAKVPCDGVLIERRTLFVPSVRPSELELDNAPWVAAWTLNAITL